jgi:Tfp pilus assembly protein PilV
MRRLRIRLKNRSGFSLIDVMIGMVVLAIALASSYHATILFSRTTATNRNLSAAVGLAEAKLEELRNAPFDEVITGADGSPITALGEANGVYTRSWNVADNTPETGLKSVTVLVSWDQWGEPEPHEYSLTAVVGP